ncbi:MAG TPA: peptidylprolyl isomerase [Steroidobacteraceae bacterium]|nr:peptidylprolyl isomerase [Steroidobacteraceae bacterium]
MSQIRPTAPTRLVGVAALTILLAACAKTPQTATPAAAKAAGPTPVAVVNGTPISRIDYDFYVKSLTGGKSPAQLTAQQQGLVLDEMISMQLMAAQAVKDGLDKNQETAAQIEVARMHLLADAESRKYLQGKAPTDQELHAEYASAIAGMDKTEYRARHILVASQALAQELTKKIKAGADFAQLAKTESIDPSKTNGGELGWFDVSRMVKPFADAVESLKKGEVTPQPVQTQYGWHIIQLEDTRPVTPPPFDQVKQQVGNRVIQKKLQAYVAQLKKTAVIQKNL